jgi:hypothetical protein
MGGMSVRAGGTGGAPVEGKGPAKEKADAGEVAGSKPTSAPEVGAEREAEADAAGPEEAELLDRSGAGTGEAMGTTKMVALKLQAELAMNVPGKAEERPAKGAKEAKEAKETRERERGPDRAGKSARPTAPAVGGKAGANAPAGSPPTSIAGARAGASTAAPGPAPAPAPAQPRATAPAPAPSPAAPPRSGMTGFLERFGVASVKRAAQSAVELGRVASANPVEINADARRFRMDTDAAIARAARAGEIVSFDDPQDFVSGDFVGRTGTAQFNRAPGGEQATNALRSYLRAELTTNGKLDGRRITQEELIYRAIKLNRGNVTLAMGSIAEVLHDHRKWAGSIDGLRNDGKDYYRFAGAYIGLQKDAGVYLAGVLGGAANVAGTPIVYSAYDAAKAAYHLATGNFGEAEKSAQGVENDLKLGQHADKVRELAIGLLASPGINADQARYR